MLAMVILSIPVIAVASIPVKVIVILGTQKVGAVSSTCRAYRRVQGGWDSQEMKKS
jgi:hypothetical protein